MGFVSPSCPCWNICWLDLIQATTDAVSSCVCPPLLSWDTISPWSSLTPASYCLYVLFSSSICGRVWYRGPTCSWELLTHFLLTTIHCSKKLLWWGLRAALTHTAVEYPITKWLVTLITSVPLLYLKVSALTSLSDGWSPRRCKINSFLPKLLLTTMFITK